jgi:hypothetical protein
MWHRRATFDYGPGRAELETSFKVALKSMNQTELAMAAAEDSASAPTTPRPQLRSTSLGGAAGSVWRHVSMDAAAHSYEHIYSDHSDLTTGEKIADASRTHSVANPTKQSSVTLGVRDSMFEEWYETMSMAFFFQPIARIQVMRNVVSQYWASQMLRRQGVYPDTADLDVDGVLGDGQVGAVMIRRGDKCVDDAYCLAHGGKFRPSGLFLHEIRQQEIRQGKPFAALYLLSDDVEELNRLLSYSRVASDPTEQVSTEAEIGAAYASKDDDAIARAILKGRWLLFNHLAPPLCFNPSTRPGFESFLVSMTFLIHHQCFVVGHESSNVSWFLARVLYAVRQRRPDSNRMGAGAWHQDVKDEYL